MDQFGNPTHSKMDGRFVTDNRSDYTLKNMPRKAKDMPANTDSIGITLGI